MAVSIRRHPDRRADRERQVGAGARARAGSSAAPSSMPIRCRSIATCASSRRGRHRPRRRGCRIGSTATSMRRRTIRSAAGASTCALAMAEACGQGASADPRRRHRPLFQGVDAGPVRRAADPRPMSAPRCARGCDAEASRGTACRAGAPRSRNRRRGLKPGDRTRIARALEVVVATGRSLADWHRDGMPADRRRRRARSKSFSLPSARSCFAASTRGSTPCWRRRARRGAGARRRAISIRCCRQ